MSHQEEEYEFVEDPPVINPPDPYGPPEPVTRNSPLWGIAVTVGVGAVALGGFVVPALLNTGRTCGATRSAKIEWEQRQRQIEQVIQEDQAVQAAATNEPEGEAPENDRRTR